MKTRNLIVTSAAAAFLLAGLAGAAHADDKSAEGKVKCEGVNSCKGHGECKSAANSCKGKNGCAGKGFVMMTPEECAAAKAEAAEKKQ